MKNYKHLTQQQRYYIYTRLSNYTSVISIAHELNLPKSTIYREIKRNSYNGRYSPEHAHIVSLSRREKPSFSQITPKVKEFIIEKLKLHWSPEQISSQMNMRSKLSHQTIYNFIHNDKAKGGCIYKKLPRKGKKYNYHGTKKSNIPNRVDISERPSVINNIQRFGDYEIDLIVGKRGGSKQCLLTLVERKSKITYIRKIPDKSSLAVLNAVISIYDSSLVPIKSITSDNGTEFSLHQEIQEQLSCKFFFARAYCSSDRGLNENTNGLIRRILPKGTDFKNVSDDTIMHIQSLLNNRPRKTLNYKTPKQVIYKHLKRSFKYLKCRPKNSYLGSKLPRITEFFTSYRPALIHNPKVA